MTKRYASIGNLCVACGTCIHVCPFGFISIPNGVRAVVDIDKCIGCGKCASVCPASEITIISRKEVSSYE